MEKRLFKFNLVPPKTKEELMVIEERDNTILYSFLLIFFAVLIFFVLTLIDALAVQPAKLTSADSLKSFNNQVEAFKAIKTKNGELFIKSRALEPLLDKDIKLTELIKIADQLKTLDSNIQVISYKREPSGSFVLSLILDKNTTLNKVIKSLSTTERVSSIFIRRVSTDAGSQGLLNATISFNIDKV